MVTYFLNPDGSLGSQVPHTGYATSPASQVYTPESLSRVALTGDASQAVRTQPIQQSSVQQQSSMSLPQSSSNYPSAWQQFAPQSFLNREPTVQQQPVQQSYLQQQSSRPLVSYVDINTGQPRTQLGISSKSGDYFGGETRDAKTYQIQTGDINYQRDAPWLRRQERELAFQIGTLRPGTTYTEEAERQAILQAKSQAQARLSAQPMSVHGYGTNIAGRQFELNKNIQQINLESKKFEDTYKDYYNPTEKSFVNLPEEASKKLTEIQNKIKDVQSQQQELSTSFQDVENLGTKYGNIETVRTNLLDKKTKELTTKYVDYQAFKGYDAAQQLAKEKELDTIQRQIQELSNAQVTGGDILPDFSTRVNPYSQLNFDITKGFGVPGFFQTTAINIEKLTRPMSLSFEKTLPGKIFSTSTTFTAIAAENIVPKVIQLGSLSTYTSDQKERAITKLKSERYGDIAKNLITGFNRNPVGWLPVGALQISADLTKGKVLKAASATPIGFLWSAIAIPESEAVALRLAPKEAVLTASNLGFNEMKKLAIQRELFESQGIKTQSFGGFKNFVRDWIPLGDIVISNKQAMFEGVSAYGQRKGLTQDQIKQLQTYSIYSQRGTSVGKFAAFVGSEVTGELTGRMLTKNLLTKSILKLKPSEAFFKTYKTITPKIRTAAFAELNTALFAESVAGYRDITAGETLVASAILPNIAGPVGGTIAGGNVVFQKLKASSRYSKLGTTTKWFADITEAWFENIGDFTADIIQKTPQKLFKTRVNTLASFYSMYDTPQYYNFPSSEVYNIGATPTTQETKIKIKVPTMNNLPVSSRTTFPVMTEMKTNLPANMNLNLYSNINLPIQSRIKQNINYPVSQRIQQNVQQVQKVQMPVFTPINEKIYEQVTNTSTNIETPVTVAPGIPIGGFPLDLPFGGIPPAFGSGRRLRKGYIPSFDAIILGIKASRKKYKKKALYTGFETRPILV